VGRAVTLAGGPQGHDELTASFSGASFIGFKFECGIPIGNQSLELSFYGRSSWNELARNSILTVCWDPILMIGLNFSLKDAVSLLKPNASSK
jgi:hypothetical protein